MSRPKWSISLLFDRMIDGRRWCSEVSGGWDDHPKSQGRRRWWINRLVADDNGAAANSARATDGSRASSHQGRFGHDRPQRACDVREAYALVRPRYHDYVLGELSKQAPRQWKRIRGPAPEEQAPGCGCGASYQPAIASTGISVSLSRADGVKGLARAGSSLVEWRRTKPRATPAGSRHSLLDRQGFR